MVHLLLLVLLVHLLLLVLLVQSSAVGTSGTSSDVGGASSSGSKIMMGLKDQEIETKVLLSTPTLNVSTTEEEGGMKEEKMKEKEMKEKEEVNQVMIERMSKGEGLKLQIGLKVDEMSGTKVDTKKSCEETGSGVKTKSSPSSTPTFSSSSASSDSSTNSPAKNTSSNNGELRYDTLSSPKIIERIGYENTSLTYELLDDDEMTKLLNLEVDRWIDGSDPDEDDDESQKEEDESQKEEDHSHSGASTKSKDGNGGDHDVVRRPRTCYYPRTLLPWHQQFIVMAKKLR